MQYGLVPKGHHLIITKNATTDLASSTPRLYRYREVLTKSQRLHDLASNIQRHQRTDFKLFDVYIVHKTTVEIVIVSGSIRTLGKTKLTVSLGTIH